MQRWLASQAKYPAPCVLIGLVTVALGIVSLVSKTGFDRIWGAVLIPLGVLVGAAGIAALRERSSAGRL